jgi:hypothetical protein
LKRNRDVRARHSDGTAAIWLMNGGTIAGGGTIGVVPTSWSIVGQRDFDGDGKSDILWRDTSGNVAMWFMNGASSIGGEPSYRCYALFGYQNAKTFFEHCVGLETRVAR